MQGKGWLVSALRSKLLHALLINSGIFSFCLLSFYPSSTFPYVSPSLQCHSDPIYFHIHLLLCPLPISLQLPLFLALSLHFQYISLQSLLHTIRYSAAQVPLAVSDVSFWWLSVCLSVCSSVCSNVCPSSSCCTRGVFADVHRKRPPCKSITG